MHGKFITTVPFMSHSTSCIIQLIVSHPLMQSSIQGPHLEKFFTEQLKSRDGHCPGELLHLGKDGRDFIKFQLTVCVPTNYAVLG